MFPIFFPFFLGGGIPSVIQMSLGEKAKLDITSDYGYGDQGAGGVIPPNADLIFEVELLKIGDLAAPEESGCGCVLL